MKKLKIYVVGGDHACAAMITQKGHEPVETVEDADVLMFTGGADVQPELYGELRHPRTFTNAPRDKFECEVFEEARKANKPMVGICRGAQFLHVMNKGKLFQDVDNHAIVGTHKVIDVSTGIAYQCTSTHHQMLQHNRGTLLAYADGLASQKESMLGQVVFRQSKGVDVEAMFHYDTTSLCFQPHPEYYDDQTRVLFWDLFDKYIAKELADRELMRAFEFNKAEFNRKMAESQKTLDHLKSLETSVDGTLIQK